MQLFARIFGTGASGNQLVNRFIGMRPFWLTFVDESLDTLLPVLQPQILNHRATSQSGKPIEAFNSNFSSSFEV